MTPLKLSKYRGSRYYTQLRILGAGGEVGELEELLGTMQEARPDLETQKTAERNKGEGRSQRTRWQGARSESTST
jgi:hypothetical protein